MRGIVCYALKLKYDYSDKRDMITNVSFKSNNYKLAGHLYLPDDEKDKATSVFTLIL